MQWLESLCADRREWKTPYYLSDGSLIATDSRFLFRVDGIPCAYPQLDAKREAPVLVLLSQPVTWRGVIDSAAFRAFVDPKCATCQDLGLSKCPKCHGQGVCVCLECDHEHDCGHCYGEGFHAGCPDCKAHQSPGYASRHNRPCRTGSAVFDRLLLAKLPKLCTGQIAVGEQIVPKQPSPGTALRLSGRSEIILAQRDWTAIVMALDIPDEGFPVLPIVAPADQSAQAKDA